MQQLFKFPMFCQLVASCLLLAFIGFQMVVDFDHISVQFLAHVQFIAYTFMELFIYCYLGEELSNEVFDTKE